MTRAIFRRFIKHLKKDVVIRKLIDRGHVEYFKVLEWVKATEAPYKNKSQRARRENHHHHPHHHHHHQVQLDA